MKETPTIENLKEEIENSTALLKERWNVYTNHRLQLITKELSVRQQQHKETAEEIIEFIKKNYWSVEVQAITEELKKRFLG